MRQAVISVYKNLGNGQYAVEPEIDVIFRQPNHNFGLALSFNFTRSFANPFSTCTINIENVSNEIINAFSYNPQDILSRPKIEVRAGEKDYVLTDIRNLGVLKGQLDLVYTGHPIYFTETKLPGRRTLTVQCSDMSAPDAAFRKTNQFAERTLILEMLAKLLNGTKYDLDDVIDQLSGAKLDHAVYYTSSNLYSQILPQLGRVYKFKFHRTEDGTLKFTPTGTIDPNPSDIVITNLNGLIEYPTSLNWCFWQIKTFFGRPVIYYPGQWMTVDATIKNNPKNSYNDFGKKSGVIVEGKYNFNDTSAEITYTMSPSGIPVEYWPVLSY